VEDILLRRANIGVEGKKYFKDDKKKGTIKVKGVKKPTTVHKFSNTVYKAPVGQSKYIIFC